MYTEKEIIQRIVEHKLDNKSEAFSLYNMFCDLLKEKYGSVDRDYDDKPTKRGNEWLDIHHIGEYELDDIARRTENAQFYEREMRNKPKDKVVVVKHEVFCNAEKMNEIRQAYPNAIIYGSEYTLEELKKYNVKDQLTYANKIEHFLLHYLIVSIRDSRFSGGPNYLWDCCVSLDLYGLDNLYKNKKNKEYYYSIMSSEEVTHLYKKLIDWKKWNINECSKYWNNFKYVMKFMNTDKVSYIENNDKFFQLFKILQYNFDDETTERITSFPYKERIIDWQGIPAKMVKGNVYSLDGKTIINFSHRLLYTRETFTVPNDIEQIKNDAFRWGMKLKKITVPATVKIMEDKVFVSRRNQYFNHVNTIVYKGSRQEWDSKFSNVELDDIELICQKRIKRKN